MIEVNGLYVSFCDDTCGNKGGYYCQVYDGEDMENEVDNFVIHAEELEGLSGASAVEKAEEIAANYVKYNCKTVKREYA